MTARVIFELYYKMCEDITTTEDTTATLHRDHVAYRRD